MHHDDDAHLKEIDARKVFALTRPDNKLFTLYLLYAFMTLAGFPFVILPLYFHFKTLRYRFDKDGVAVSYGILWRKESYLTYSRIQDIHVARNVFERWLGLGRVEIQTASGSAGAEESIVGVREFNEIRNFLYARMRGHQPQEEQMTGDEVRTILAGIRDELKAMRGHLEGRRRV